MEQSSLGSIYIAGIGHGLGVQVDPVPQIPSLESMFSSLIATSSDGRGMLHKFHHLFCRQAKP